MVGAAYTHVVEPVRVIWPDWLFAGADASRAVLSTRLGAAGPGDAVDAAVSCAAATLAW